MLTHHFEIEKNLLRLLNKVSDTVLPYFKLSKVFETFISFIEGLRT